MSKIKRTASHTYGETNNRNEEAHSETNIASKHNLKQFIKQTTLKDSQKIDMSKSKHPLNMLKKAITQSIRKTDQACHICEMRYDIKDITKISTCDHKFCKTCIESYLNYKINAFEPIACPQQKCEGAFSKESESFLALPIEMKKKYEKNLKFIEANKNPLLKQCHETNCQGYFDTGSTPSFCEICKVEYCPKCTFKAHAGECQDFHVEFLQNNYKYRQCNLCKNMIQKNEGCNHISCRCGHNFCYLCGADWAIDPCRYGGNPPPPPPPPREPKPCCIQYTLIILKLIFITVYSIIAFPIWLVVCIVLIVVSFLVSIAVGGAKLYWEIISDTQCVTIVFASLFLPLIMLGGIFWYFFDNIDVTCDFLGSVTQGMLFPIGYVWDACE